MTFKRTVQIWDAEGAASELEKITQEVKNASLPEATKSFLLEQLENNLGIFGRQLSLKSTQSMKADRVFEGDGYKIVVRVRPRASGPLSQIATRLGF